MSERESQKEEIQLESEGGYDRLKLRETDIETDRQDKKLSPRSCPLLCRIGIAMI